MANHNADPDSSETNAELPLLSDRMSVRMIPRPHAAVLTPAVLLEQCELRTQRRSGPGGQHRNKTSSGVFLTHVASQIIAEATERRSQADNRNVALLRLRYRLAIEVRSESIFDTPAEPIEGSVRDRYHQNLKRMNDGNEDKPAVLALLLNDLHAAGGQPSLVGKQWKVSTSSIVSLVRSVPAAFAWLNRLREHHDRKSLR